MTIQLIKDESGTNTQVNGVPTSALSVNNYIVDIEDTDLITISDSTSPLAGGEFSRIMSRIPYTLFTKSDGNVPVSAIDLKNDMDAQITQTAPDDINAGYLGVWDASTNIPDISSLVDSVNGDWYYVGVDGNYNPNTGILDTQTGTDPNNTINDIVKYNGTSWDTIDNLSLRVSDIENSALDQFDVHVDIDARNNVTTGSSLNPYKDIQLAINASNDGDRLLIKGTYLLSSNITIPDDKSLSFYGTNGTTIKYTQMVSGNGELLRQLNTGCTKRYSFNNITFSNSDQAAIQINSAHKVEFHDCIFTNNGWTGSGLNTFLPDDGTNVGYDSSDTDLDTFSRSSDYSDAGSGIKVRNTNVFILDNCEMYDNNNAVELTDVGTYGFGVILRNQIYNNAGDGIKLVGSTGNSSTGCSNFTIFNNNISMHAGEAIYSVGGIKNIIALNTIKSNWLSGIHASYSSNLTVRDNYIEDNNRGPYINNGRAALSDSSVYINGSDINPVASFMLTFINNQIVDTGISNLVTKKGITLHSDLDNINDRDKSVITLDNNLIQNQIIAENIEIDLNILKLIKGDSTYISNSQNDVLKSGTGYYYEMPFANQHTNAATLDFTLDDSGSSIIVKETNITDTINFYAINQLKALSFGTKVRIVLDGSSKIQFDDVPVSGITINGSNVNPVLSTAVDDLNGLFTQTLGFVAEPDVYPISGELENDTITITMTDNTTFGIDVAPLAVDTTVTSVELNGNILDITLSDTTVISEDLSILGIDTNIHVASGSLNSGNDNLTLTLNDATIVDVDVSALNIDTNLYLDYTSLTDANNTLNMILSDGSIVTQDVTALNIDTNTTVVSGLVNGNTLTLTLNDTNTIDIDVTTLAVDTNNEVVSGLINGDTLTLTMSDASLIDIDVTLLNNGYGSTSDHAPHIDNHTLFITEGFTLNHTLTLNNAAIATLWGYDDLPSWIVADQHNGHLLGLAPAFVGSGAHDDYTFTVHAGNPFGIDVADVTITVLENTNTTNWTKALDFDGASDHCKIKKSNDNENPLRRNSNGDGRAWTVSSTFERQTSTGIRTLWSQSTTNGNSPSTYLQMNNNTLKFVYGTPFNKLTWTHTGFFSGTGIWDSLVVTFDGGTTGSSSGSINNYYSRFKVYSVDTSTGTATDITSNGTWSHTNYGYNGNSIDGSFYVGTQYSTTNEWLGKISATCVTNAEITDLTEIGLFAYDPLSWRDDPTNVQGTILSTNTHARMNHIWLMGDGIGDAYSDIKNQVFNNPDTRMQMKNMNANDIVNISL